VIQEGYSKHSLLRMQRTLDPKSKKLDYDLIKGELCENKIDA
jgi:hypothetical protein